MWHQGCTSGPPPKALVPTLTGISAGLQFSVTKHSPAPCYVCFSQKPIEVGNVAPIVQMRKLRLKRSEASTALEEAELEHEASPWDSTPRAHGQWGRGDYSHWALPFVPGGVPSPEAGSTHQMPASDTCSLANSPV